MAPGPATISGVQTRIELSANRWREFPDPDLHAVMERHSSAAKSVRFVEVVRVSSVRAAARASAWGACEWRGVDVL